MNSHRPKLSPHAARQPPTEANLASIEAALGYQLCLEDRIIEPLFKFARSIPLGTSSQSLMMTAAFKTVWALEREMKKHIIGWKRRMSWEPYQRNLLAYEIVAFVADSALLDALVSIRSEQIIFDEIYKYNKYEFLLCKIDHFAPLDAIHKIDELVAYIEEQSNMYKIKNYHSLLSILWHCSCVRNAVFN